MRQDEALTLLKMGKNVFLTGAAGSGKTWLLNQFIKFLKEKDIKVAVTASTGIAATHIHGTTIHSWSGMGIRETITSRDLEKLMTTPRVKKNYKKTKVLIIDEISMLHNYQLDMINTIAKYILGSEEPFGGIQVVLCGDFFQLPPVTSSPDPEKKQFAFEAAIWKEADFKVCYLHEQHRQGNDPLLAVLNDIRNGTAGEHTKVPLRTRYKKEPEGSTKPTKLYSRNINVDLINDNELAKIEGETQTFTMISEGFEALAEGLKKNCLAPERLQLKIGAEVMFVKNAPLGSYVNGTRGVVTGFDKDDSNYPIVKTSNNKTIIASPEDWIYEDNGITRAKITQIPLRLAWAITIHKSQGMTLDAAEIDLGDAFEPGMGYVALSRVRGLTGLKLMNLNEMALKVHPKILEKDEIFKADSALVAQHLQGLSDEEKASCYKESAPVTRKNKMVKIASGETIPTHIITGEIFKENSSIELTAEIRGLTTSTITRHIEKLIGLKQIDKACLIPLKNQIPPADFDVILSAWNKSEDGKLKSVYEKFEGKYSYADIQLVRLLAL